MQTQHLALVPAAAVQGPSVAGGSSGVSLEKQQQKAIKTRVLDYVGPCLRLMKARMTAPSVRHASHLQPVFACGLELLPPCAYPHNPAISITTKFVTSSFFRHRAAINHLLYTPDGRRLLCGGNNGNVSLWNGSNFENELGPGIQAHEAAPIRCMTFAHSGLYLLSCDDLGRVKFSKPTLEVLQVYQAHKEACRSVSFAPTDFKFATGSDDSTVRVFDTFRGQEMSMTGHGGDVRWVDWHPYKGCIASASKDACVKLWDPRVGACLSTLHGHKNGIFQAKWSRNGHWLLTCSRDQLIKLYDVRMLREAATFAGHGRDVTCVAWHPQQEELFVSGAVDGCLMFWLASRSDAQGMLPAAHEAACWSTAWHPLGHVLASAGADQRCQFWCRARPGDFFQDGHGRDDGAAGGVSGTTDVAPGLGTASFLGGTGGGGWPATLSGLGSDTAPPAAAAAAAASRQNIIPGIGAVLDQLATANLQGLMATAPPRSQPVAMAATTHPGGGGAAKRGREEAVPPSGPGDGARPRPPTRFMDGGGRDRAYGRGTFKMLRVDAGPRPTDDGWGPQGGGGGGLMAPGLGVNMGGGGGYPALGDQAYGPGPQPGAGRGAGNLGHDPRRALGPGQGQGLHPHAPPPPYKHGGGEQQPPPHGRPGEHASGAVQVPGYNRPGPMDTRGGEGGGGGRPPPARYPPLQEPGASGESYGDPDGGGRGYGGGLMSQMDQRPILGRHQFVNYHPPYGEGGGYRGRGPPPHMGIPPHHGGPSGLEGPYGPHDHGRGPPLPHHHGDMQPPMYGRGRGRGRGRGPPPGR